MYLICIFGSKLIRSNYQPIKRNSVGPGNSLILGHHSLIVILITASLSSNTYNKASWCENWTWEGTQSIWFQTLIIPWDRLFGPWSLSRFTTGCSVVSWVWIVFPWTETSRSDKSRAVIVWSQSSVQRYNFSSVELCETAVSFLHTPNFLEQMYDFPKRTMLFQKWIFESSRYPSKLSWNSPILQCFAVLLA